MPLSNEMEATLPEKQQGAAAAVFPFLPHSTQCIVLCSIALILNTVFLAVLVTGDKKMHLFYRTCLATFTAANIVYILLYLATWPLIDLSIQGALLIGHGPACDSKPISSILFALMYLIVVHSTFLLALHFLFIYTQINPEWSRVHAFLRKRRALLAILIGDVLFMLLPSLVTFLRLTPNALVEENLRNFAWKKYGIDIYTSGYIASLFRSLNADGTYTTQWDHVICKVCIYLQLLLTMSFNFTLCYKIFMRLRKLPSHSSTNRLQLQMFRSLVAQTVIPFSLCYTPSMLTYTLPLMMIDGSVISPLCSFLLILFPIVEPIVLLYFLPHLRRHLARGILFLLGIRQPKGSTSVFVVSETAPSAAARVEMSMARQSRTSSHYKKRTSR